MLMNVGNTIREQMRMARQLTLFQVSGHRNDSDRVCVRIPYIIRENRDRTDSVLHTGILMPA